MKQRGGLCTVLYADILFLIDFSMDYLSLFLTAKLLSLRTGRTAFLRMLAAASLGGVYGVASTACGIGGIFGALLMLSASCFMTVIAFGFQSSVLAVGRATCTVWGCGTLIGGVMTAFSGIFSGGGDGGGFDLICAAVITTVAVVSFVRRRLTRGYCEIAFAWKDKQWAGRALIDSGNLLTDPIGGYPVVLLSAQAARTFLDDEVDSVYAGIASEASCGVRVVPMHTVHGTRLLYGFLCRDLTVQYGRSMLRKSAVVCIDHGINEKDGYSGCEALLPASLLF